MAGWEVDAPRTVGTLDIPERGPVYDTNSAATHAVPARVALRGICTLGVVGVSVGEIRFIYLGSM